VVVSQSLLKRELQEETSGVSFDKSLFDFIISLEDNSTTELSLTLETPSSKVEVGLSPCTSSRASGYLLCPQSQSLFLSGSSALSLSARGEAASLSIYFFTHYFQASNELQPLQNETQSFSWDLDPGQSQ